MKREKILIVEDETAILTGLVDLLQGEGYQVSTAVDGLKALDLYNQEQPARSTSILLNCARKSKISLQAQNI